MKTISRVVNDTETFSFEWPADHHAIKLTAKFDDLPGEGVFIRLLEITDEENDLYNREIDVWAMPNRRECAFAWRWVAGVQKTMRMAFRHGSAVPGTFTLEVTADDLTDLYSETVTK